MPLGRAHDQRLRAMYRSAGWPCLDVIEIELLAAGLLERVVPAIGAETLRVTDAGIQRIADALTRNRATLDRHEALVGLVAEQQAQQGRIVYRGLNLLAKPGDEWLRLRPDVYSIRNTTVEDYLEPLVFEIKVRRGDLQADLRKADKRAGYLAMASACWYVLAEGIAEPGEIPPECGVMIARGDRLEVARPAPRRAMRLAFTTWMALAKHDRVRVPDEPEALL
jgi:hypothetical protein